MKGWKEKCLRNGFSENLMKKLLGFCCEQIGLCSEWRVDNCKGKDVDYKFAPSSRGLAIVLEIVFSVENENLQKGLCSDVMNQFGGK